MTASAGSDVHHGAPRCLLRLFDAAVGGLVAWSEFDAGAERWRIEVRGLSREDLVVLIESSTTEHRNRHQEEGDFVRRGRRGRQKTLDLYGRPYYSLLALFRWGSVELRTLAEYRAGISNGSRSR